MIPVHPQAVYALECSCDGAIPADEMAQARAIDAAFEAANPDYNGMAATKLGWYRQELAEIVAGIRAKGRNRPLTIDERHAVRSTVELIRHFRKAAGLYRCAMMPSIRRAA